MEEDIIIYAKRALVVIGVESDPKHVISVRPTPKPRMTRADAWKKRPVIMKYWAWKDEFVAKANVSGLSLENVLDILFVLKMPKSWSGKKCTRLELTEHLQKPDRDNLLKAVQDSWGVDDSAVWDGRTTKIWGAMDLIIVY